MNYSYRKFFQNLYITQEQQFRFAAQTESEYCLWKEAFLSALKETLGLNKLARIGEAVAGQKPRLLEESQKDGYLCRKYVLETLPDVFMPFYMLIPDTATDAVFLKLPDLAAVPSPHTAPAIITIPAHGANKNTVCGIAENREEAQKIKDAPEECYGQIFAQKGYVVFCPDPPGYGERVEPMPTEDSAFGAVKKRTSLDCSCKDLAQTAEAFGFSLTSLEVWELQKILDFAGCCPEIATDENGLRIGCAGFSGGGQYSMWLSALDERIRLCVISGYVHGYLDSLLGCHLCPCNYAPGLWTLGDISDICSLIAPRPLFVENGIDDIENGADGISGPRRQLARIMNAYQLFGQEELLIHHTPAGSHKWHGGCYQFVDKWL